MTVEQIVSWGLQFAMAILLAMWGRAQKQADALIAEKMGALKAEIVAAVTAQEKLLVLQLAVRDQQLLAIHDRLDRAGQKSSDLADMVTVKINDIDHRVTILETRLTRMSPP